jgi:guanine deaminase
MFMNQASHHSPMEKAIAEARRTMKLGAGGPFGAVVTGPGGKVLAIASNTVLGDHDPTAHAEINAIRQAGKVLGTHDLRDCTLYATAYPCPMCLAAIVWANIRDVYFGCTPEDAAAIGFRDEMIYQYMRGETDSETLIRLHPLQREEALRLFQEYAENAGTLY